MRTDLVQGDIPKHIVNIALPASVGFFFNTMLNVVDTYYGGQISNEALAAMSLSFPVFLLILAVSYGIGTASTSLVGNEIGAGNKDEIQIYASQSFSLGIISSIMVAILGLYFSEIIFRFLGASGSYLSLACEYTNVLFVFVFSFIIVQISSSLLSAHGDTRKNRNFLIFSFVLNCILDPILMDGLYGFPKMGLSGIALATVITQLVGIPYLCNALIQFEVIDRSCFKKAIPNLSYYGKILYQAIPASLNMMTVALGFFVTTYYVNKFGHEAIAAFGVGTRIEQIILLPAIGLNIAVLSLVSQNNGANRIDRVQQSFQTALKYVAILMSIGALLTIIFSEHLLKLFTDSELVLKIGVRFLLIESFAFIAYSTLYVSTSALQGLKLPIFAIWLGVIRQIILPLIAMFYLIELMGYGIDSIWWSRLVITCSAGLFTACYVDNIIKRKLAK